MSSSVMRRSERPKIVSFGGLRRSNDNILLEAGLRLTSRIGKSLICREMGQHSSDIDEFTQIR